MPERLYLLSEEIVVEERNGIDKTSVEVHLYVDVHPGGGAGPSHHTDDLALFDPLADFDDRSLVDAGTRVRTFEFDKIIS